jgi:hypothetical protein
VRRKHAIKVSMYEVTQVVKRIIAAFVDLPGYVCRIDNQTMFPTLIRVIYFSLHKIATNK